MAYTRQQLETALRNADAAGDEQAAMAIASELRKLQQETQTPQVADDVALEQPQQAQQAIAQPQQQQQAEPFKRQFSDIFTGRGAEAPETQELPELQESGLLAGEDPMAGVKVAPALLTATDPNEIAQIITSNFPNVGTTYQRAPDGSVYPVLVNNETGAATVINRPGISGLDVLQGLGLAAAFTPAGRGGGIVQTAAKSGATGAGIEAMEEAVGGQFDVEQPFIEAGLGAVGAGLAKGFNLMRDRSQGKQQIIDLIDRNIPDASTARYRLEGGPRGEPPIIDAPEQLGDAGQNVYERFANRLLTGGERLRVDPVANEAIKQGFDEGTIAAVKMASPADKKKMLQMVERMRKGKNNRLFFMRNRPSDVAGDSLMDRVGFVLKKNRQAASELDGVAEKLVGEQLDFDPAVNDFIQKLDKAGIKLDWNPKTNQMEPNFFGSDVEGLTGAENIIENIIRRMSNTRVPDAYDLHRLKRFIDENVSYGKGPGGLSGRMQGIMKSFRRDIDQLLDTNFPEYNRVNTTYSDTITALDEINSATAAKIDLTMPNAEKALGTELRKLLSNYSSRTNLLNSLDTIESTAKKYGKEFDDDLLTQTLFYDELNQVFGTPARTSLAGETERTTKRAVESVADDAGMFRNAIDFVGKAAEKARGINEEAAFNIIEELLKRQD